MANAARGEVDLIVFEDEPTRTETFTLFLSTNAVCELQKRTGKTYGAVLRSMDDLDVDSFREVVWAALKKYHGRRFNTPEKVGDLIDDAKRHRVQKALYELFVLNLPPKDEEQEAAVGPERPTEPVPDGTGVSSTSMVATTG